MYQKVCFYIHSQCDRGRGFPNISSEIAFREEVKRLFRCAGWEIISGYGSESDHAVKGKQTLSLYPTGFVGIILTEEIPSVRNAMRPAKHFRISNIERNEFYQDMSDVDYYAYLRSRREEITADILRNYKTKSRDMFYTGNMNEIIGRKYLILRVGHDSEPYDMACRYVDELTEELIADGQLRTGNTKYGRGIRTALKSELQPSCSQAERRVNA